MGCLKILRSYCILRMPLSLQGLSTREMHELVQIAFKIAAADEQSAAFLCFRALVIISGLILLKSHETATRGTG